MWKLLLFTMLLSIMVYQPCVQVDSRQVLEDMAKTLRCTSLHFTVQASDNYGQHKYCTKMVHLLTHYFTAFRAKFVHKT